MAAPTPDIFYDYEHFTLDKLERIEPVAQTRPIGEMQVTLLSLECYAAGFVAATLIEAPWERPGPEVSPERWEPPPLLRNGLNIVDALDDRGNHYAGRPRAGAGGGQGAGEIALRNVYCFTPALDREARSLTLTIALIERANYDRHGNPAWSDEHVLDGPWTATFSLPAATGEPA